MKRQKANVRIRQGMRRNEREVLRRIKRDGHFRLEGMLSPIAQYHAVDRLEAQGVIRYAKSKRYIIGGYVLKGARFVDRSAR